MDREKGGGVRNQMTEANVRVLVETLTRIIGEKYGAQVRATVERRGNEDRRQTKEEVLIRQQ